MLAILLVVTFFAMWVFIAQRAQFIDQFAKLLDRGAVRRTPADALAGRAFATGTYNGRDVAVRMQMRRSRHDQAYLVVAMRVSGPESLTYADIEARASDDAGRWALAKAAGQDLLLNVEEGWLKALWRPQGFTFFPGRFAVDTWRTVLDSLSVVATSIESARPSPGSGGAS